MQQHARPDMIDPYRLVQFLSEMKGYGLKAVTIVGNGEPLSHPMAGEIIQQIGKLGLEIGIFTNASYLDEDRAEMLLKYATFVRMTLNGANWETYQLTHGLQHDSAQHEFERCIENMRLFADQRDIRGINSLPTVGIQCATHQWNYRELPEQALLVRDTIKADYFSIKPVINRSPFHGRRVTDTRPRNAIDLEELEPILKACEALQTDTFQVYAKREQFQEALPHDFNDGRDYVSCIALPFEAYIHENGNFDICGPIKLGGTYATQPLVRSELDEIQGKSTPEEGPFNIYKMGFAEIWHSEERRRMIDSINLNHCPAACRPHPLNKILWGIKKEGIPAWASNLGTPSSDLHVNFL